MKVYVASFLDKFLQVLNERGRYVVHQLGEVHPKDWDLVRYGDVRDFLQWKYVRKGAQNNPALEHHSGPGSGGVRTSFQGNVVVTVHFESDISTPLYRNIKDPIKFSKLLAEVFLSNKFYLNSETYKKLRTRVDVFETKEERILERMYQVFHFWMGGGNYEKTVKWGQLLDKLTPYMPPSVKSSPKTTLFRLIAIDQAAFNRMRKGKPLILDNRMYSSWTTSAKAAMNFAVGFNREPNQVLVILKKTFDKKDILVNIEELQRFLLAKGKPVQQYSDAVDEKEIIVRNAHKDYQFTTKNISRYQDENGRWIKM